jgi:hypothetical protein
MSSERLLRRAAAGARRSSNSDASSTLSSEDDQIHDIVADEPLYYVMLQFLVTEDGRNIATVLSELTNEVKELRLAMDKLAIGAKKERRDAPEPREGRRERRAREAREESEESD